MPADKVTKIVDFTDASPSSGDMQDSASLDAYFDEVKDTVNSHADDLDVLLRDDGQMQDDILQGPEASPAFISFLKPYFNDNTALTWRSAWVTTTVYASGDLVEESGNCYICVIPHTSGTFATDLAALKWELFAASTATLAPSTANKALIDDGAGGSVWGVIDAARTDGSFAPKASPTLTGTIQNTGITSFTGDIIKAGGIKEIVDSSCRVVMSPDVYNTVAATLAFDMQKNNLKRAHCEFFTSAITISIGTAPTEAGYMFECLFTAHATNDRTLTWPAGVVWIGFAPPTLLATKSGVLTGRYFAGTAASSLVLSWAEEL